MLLSDEGECGKLKGRPTQVGHPFGLHSISQNPGWGSLFFFNQGEWCGDKWLCWVVGTCRCEMNIWHCLCYNEDDSPSVSQGCESTFSTSSTAISERVTGRKARGLQMEEIACKCQTYLSLLSRRRKQTSNIFFPSLYKFKERFLLKYCVAIMTPGFTWS